MGSVRTRYRWRKQQVPPLRFAPVGMTIICKNNLGITRGRVPIWIGHFKEDRTYDWRVKTSLGAKKKGGTMAGMLDNGNISSGSSMPKTSIINFRLF